jgi:N-acetylglucosaminyldiphosphoundecaprenol N-acetyl-beta-D-mannosaminyltransferase
MPIEAATTRFAGVDFHALHWSQAVATITGAAARGDSLSIVTPNVDHIVRMDRLGDEPLGLRYRAAIRDADLCLCDSRIVSRLARLRRVDLPVVPGSDMTAALFREHIHAGDRIAIVGGDAETIALLKTTHPGVDFVQHIPPMGMLKNESAMAAAARFIRDTRAKYVFVAVGSPQGEILVQRARETGTNTGVILSIGASIDFVTGRLQRAPRWMQKLGIEWAHRLLSEPKRLWRRYLVDGPRIFAIVMRRGG